jgi:hypothetical protein
MEAALGEFGSEAKGNVKGNGQECPFYAGWASLRSATGESPVSTRVGAAAGETKVPRFARNDKFYLELAAPDALLGVEGGEHYGLVVDAGGVAVDGGGGLGAEVAVAGVEVEGADVVGAVGAGELHASLDPRDAVKALHRFESSLFVEK